MKPPTISIHDLVHENIGRNPTPFSLDRNKSPYLYKLYTHLMSIQPEKHYIIDHIKPLVYSKMHPRTYNSTINGYVDHVPLETDSTVTLHVLHNKALQKLANQLPVMKPTTATRIHRIDLLFIDLCLVSKMVTRELKLQYVSIRLRTPQISTNPFSFDVLSEHVKALKYTTSPWVTNIQDCAIRIILEFLRNIHVDNDCPSAKYSILSTISGLEFILQENFVNHIYNFHYIYGLV